MLPLEDIRIVAIEQYGAGPFGTLQLADLGAEIIKVEDPRFGGDVARYVPPLQEERDSIFFESFNRNKRSITLDLSTSAGRQVFEDLVRQSDAVFSNLRGDVPKTLRITYADLRHLNPRIVCVSLSGFGMTGPRRAEPGYDYILQGLTGWMTLTGAPEHPPTKTGLSLVDYSGGYVAAISLLAAIHAARRDGRGSDCDLSLFDTALSLLTYPAAWYLNGGVVPERRPQSAHPSLVPFQAFEASDGWLTVACPKEKFWRRLCTALDHPELSEDDRFDSFARRHENEDVLWPILNDLFASRTVDEWVERLTEAGVPNGPVLSVEEALNEAQVRARGMVVETVHPRFGTVRQVASGVRVGEETIDHRRAPFLDENRGDILEQILGYSVSTIEALDAEGAFGPGEADK